ncbi:MAG: 5-methylthioadenosine/S-adenosylhomocysteine deaminase [Candidatus Azotimanducaceae bacterium]|jgi:5-methylthioadenosine/S-adenosylhomocysteine deaminase
MTATPEITLVSPTWIAPVIPEGSLLKNHSLVLSGRHIMALIPQAEAFAKYPTAADLTLHEHIVTPGLVDAHGHAAMTLLRGDADDRELMDWLHNHIWPAEAEFVDYDFVYDGSTLAVAEMIQRGTTCAADTYFFPNAVANAFSDNHFRGQVCIPIIEFRNSWAKDEDEHLHKGMQVFDDLIRDNPFPTAAFAPHSPYTLTDHGFEQTLRFRNELQLRIHLNLHETLIEVTDAVRLRGQRHSKRIQDLGLLSPLLQTVHMTQFAPDEIKSLVDNKVHVAHCPESNLELTSGFCQVAGLLEANVNVAIGTDGAASNNNLDMLGELRTAAILAKAVSNDATAVSAHQALSMATINSARMLGLDNQIGSLEPGKLADLVAIDLSGLSFQPLHNPTSQLSSAATGHQVSHVWIDGIQVLAGGVLTELNTQRARANARQWHNTISQFGSL